jgi:predicted enzyme related to lactoylglutathione lyase
MARAQGSAGFFIKANDPKQMLAWYDRHLGISPLPHSPWGSDDESPLFEWRDKDDPERICYSVVGIFPMDTDFFAPTEKPYIFGLRVDDLDAMLAKLKAGGTDVQGDIQAFNFGRIARILDPEGNAVDLWEPAEGF